MRLEWRINHIQWEQKQLKLLQQKLNNKKLKQVGEDNWTWSAKSNGVFLVK